MWKGTNSTTMTFTQSVMFVIDSIPDSGVLSTTTKHSFEASLNAVLCVLEFLGATFSTAIRMAA